MLAQGALMHTRMMSTLSRSELEDARELVRVYHDRACASEAAEAYIRDRWRASLERAWDAGYNAAIGDTQFDIQSSTRNPFVRNGQE